MLTTSARLLELLSLLQSRREWTGPELAGRLAVGPRTIRRDVERLRALGYPVHARPGVAGGYRLGAGASLPPLLLDAEEAVAVAVALRTSASTGLSGIEQTSVRALAKLESLLPAGLRRRVGAVGSATVAYAGPRPTVDPELLAAVALATRDRRRLRFAYRDHEGRRSRRAVEPSALVHTGRRWYLVAWDGGRSAWRTFRLDRVEPPVSSGAAFGPREPPSPDIADFVARSIASARERHAAEVVLHAPAAELQARVPRSVGTLERLDGDRCLLRAGSDGLGWLAMFIADLGVDFEVLGPPELRGRVETLAARLARAAAAAG